MCFVLAVCFSTLAEAAPRKAIPKKPVAPVALPQEVIQQIQVKGNAKVDTDAILEKIKSSVGKELDNAQVREDILALHKLSLFEEVEVRFEAGTLVFQVRERPTISRIVFFGNEEIEADDLKGVLSIKTFDLFDENLVRESARKLERHYEEKGFYLARVSHEVRKGKDADSLEVLFRVREYDKVKIRKITFLGNKAFTDEQLKRILRNTQEGGFFSALNSSGNFKELDFKTDLQILQYWYLNEGYVRFKHENPVVTVTEDKKWIHITIKVDEGKKYSVADTDFTGDLLFPKDELHETLTLKKGETFSISKRNADILALTEKYQDLGYANANVVPDIQIDDEKLMVSTVFDFEKGTLVRFGKISVKGNSKTRDKVVRRELLIQEGELYSGTGFRESKENVERLGFFEADKVEFTTKAPPGRPDIMDVEINVKERPTGQFQLGAGYATTTKFFFSTSVAETNFLGRGQDLRFNGQMAADRRNRSLSVSFTDPYAFDSKWSLGGDVDYVISVAPDIATEIRRGTGVRVGHPVGQYSRLFLGYRLEEQRLIDVVDPVVNENLGREEGTKSAFTVTLSHDRRNNRMETTKGYFASWSEEVAGLGGNRRFLRSILDLRWYRPVIGDLVFKTKGEFGNIWDHGGNGIQRLERFYLGGPNNLRGYAPFSVGPTQRRNNVDFQSGGSNQFFYMAELEYPIAKDIGLKAVAFYDFGDAFNKFNEVSVKQDYGWGFRWFSPIGPLRFEWGYPIQKKGSRRGSEFNFMIGPPF